MSTQTTQTTLSPTALTGDYAVDVSHSRVGFVARHAMVTKVRGQFNDFEATAHLDFANPEQSSLQATVQVASVDTRNAQRDEHLRTNDFFDAPNNPQITFASTSVRKADGDFWEVTGDLSIKGTTKPVTIMFEFTGAAIDPWGNTRVGFEGQVSVNRRDWGINWNSALEAGGVLVSDKVTLEFEISAVKQ